MRGLALWCLALVAVGCVQQGQAPPAGRAQGPAPTAAAVPAHRDVELEVRQRYRRDGGDLVLDRTEFTVTAARPDGLELLVLAQGERPIDIVPVGSGFITITDYVSPGFVVDRLSLGDAATGSRRLNWRGAGLPAGVETDPYRAVYVLAARDGTMTTTLTWHQEDRAPAPAASGLDLRLYPATFASAFASDQTPSLGVALFNTERDRRSIRLACTLAPVASGQWPVASNQWPVAGPESAVPSDAGLPCGGAGAPPREVLLEPLEKVSFDWPLAVPGYGKWTVRVRAEGEGSEAATGLSEASASVVRFPSRPAAQRYAEQSRFGVNWAPQRALPLLARAGIRWERHIFALWDVLAAERGAARWSYSDAYLRAAQAHGIQLLGYFLGYDKRWTRGLPLSDDFARLVGDVVERYRGSVQHWELWNEPEEPTFFRGSVEDYLALHEGGAAAVRQADAAARVHMAGSGHWRAGQFVDRFLQLGGGRATDIANLHPYAFPQPPEEEFRRRIQQSQRLLQQHRLNRPLWITEMCWPTHPDFSPGHYWVSEEEQAQFLARAAVLAVAEGVEKIFWFGLGDNPLDRPNYYPYNGCGLVDWDGFARPALVAYANLSWHLEGSSYLGRLPLGDEALQAHLFRRGEEGVAVVWSARVPRTVMLPFQPAEGDVRDLYGNPIPFERARDGIHLVAGGSPAYLTFGL